MCEPLGQTRTDELDLVGGNETRPKMIKDVVCQSLPRPKKGTTVSGGGGGGGVLPGLLQARRSGWGAPPDVGSI